MIVEWVFSVVGGGYGGVTLESLGSSGSWATAHKLSTLSSQLLQQATPQLQNQELQVLLIAPLETVLLVCFHVFEPIQRLAKDTHNDFVKKESTVTVRSSQDKLHISSVSYFDSNDEQREIRLKGFKFKTVWFLNFILPKNKGINEYCINLCPYWSFKCVLKLFKTCSNPICLFQKWNT